MSESNLKIFIIILNFNGRDTIKECLDSVYKSDYPNYEVVVVDNASKDGSIEIAKKYFSRSHFVLNGDNLGFAAGNNTAIRFALEKFADYIFFLNNDAVIKKNTLSNLVKEAEKNKMVGIVSPIIRLPDGSVWYAGGKIQWFRMRAKHVFKAKNDFPYETDFASGCAMMVKKEVFREIGLLDEKYFLYYEDVDFCARARKKGFKILVAPDACVIHYEKSENNIENKTYWLVLSGIIFFKKHTSALLRLWINFYLISRKVKNWLDVKIKRSAISLTVQKAYKDYKNLKFKD